jgi:hypothetical protein
LVLPTDLENLLDELNLLLVGESGQFLDPDSERAP